MFIAHLLPCLLSVGSLQQTTLLLAALLTVPRDAGGGELWCRCQIHYCLHSLDTELEWELELFKQ